MRSILCAHFLFSAGGADFYRRRFSPSKRRGSAAQSGVWSDPANWSTGVVPGTQDEVLIDSNAGQESTVVLDVNTTLLNLKLDALDTLQVANNKQPTIGALQIAGTVDVGPTSRLVVQNSLWVQPEGRILMNDTPTTVGAWLQLQVAPFWNQGLIEGGGWANAPMFVNEGRVEANLSAQTLEITLGSGANHRNYGDIIASNGGWLSLRGGNSFSGDTSILNFSGITEGLIEAKPGSTATIDNMTIVGGEINGAAGENGMRLTNVTLNGVRLEGDISGSRFSFQNVVENNAVITPFTGSPLMTVTGPSTLTGTGRIDLRNGVIQGLSSNFPNSTLINGPTHTIEGPGTIGGGITAFRFVNRGLVDANKFGEAATLTVNLGTNTLQRGERWHDACPQWGYALDCRRHALGVRKLRSG